MTPTFTSARSLSRLSRKPPTRLGVNLSLFEASSRACWQSLSSSRTRTRLARVVCASSGQTQATLRDPPRLVRAGQGTELKWKHQLCFRNEAIGTGEGCSMHSN